MAGCKQTGDSEECSQDQSRMVAQQQAHALRIELARLSRPIEMSANLVDAPAISHIIHIQAFTFIHQF